MFAGWDSFWREFIRQFTSTFITDNRYKQFVTGFLNTLIIMLGAAALGIVIGTLAAVVRVTYAQAGRRSLPLKILNVVCGVYLTVIRGTPVVVQLMIMYFMVLKSIDNGVLVAVIAFGINSGAYVAEIIRAGIISVDSGQREAGQSLGLSGGMVMRLVILPQAVKNILPALGNEAISLLKETAVAGYITVMDLAKAGEYVRYRNMQSFPLIFVALVYLLLFLIMKKGQSVLERRLRKSDRG